MKAKRCAIKNICYPARQGEMGAWEGSLHCLSCDKAGDLPKGERRHGASPPGVKEDGKDSWALGTQFYFLLCISLRQGCHQGSSLAICTPVGTADIDLSTPPQTPVLSEIPISNVSLLVTCAKFPASMVWSGLFRAVDCKTHQSSTAPLAIAAGIRTAALSPFLED